MRAVAYGKGISVHAIAGTHVVLFGFDVPPNSVTDLMGFAIKKTDKQTQRSDYLDNFLLLKANDRGEKSNHTSYRNPFQEFVWGDYTLSPAQEYSYEVTAMYGTPGALKRGPRVDVDVKTESEAGDVHDVFFNRGVAGSQAYSRKFTPKGQTKPPAPAEAGPAAYAWLSRGLFEGMRAFIEQASGPKFGLRAALYEFTYGPTLTALAVAAAKGADVQVIFDSVDNATKNKPIPYPREANKAAIAAAKLGNCQPRTKTKIAHNKFVVLLENGKPTAVWTGSTNVTEGAYYGQWNVGHLVRDPALAARYLDFWNELHRDPEPKAARDWDGKKTAVPKEPHGLDLLFSPRHGLEALTWYAKLMDEAKESVFLTAAFGVSKELTKVFEEDKPYLRYLLLDKRKGEVQLIARNPSNRVVAGGYLGPKDSRFANWMEEALTGLNDYVQYVHTKIMLLDPLGDDPIVISGSANFSEPSTTSNDENMLVIRGDTRVADIYLGEFMRLFTHFRFRAKTKTPKEEPAPGPTNPTPRSTTKLYLRDDDSWARRFFVKDSPRQKERLLFRAPPRA
jgi:phosphatidylserine/phosphatidylglycerophosphate/cardiolipin synthase-like enzyme